MRADAKGFVPVQVCCQLDLQQAVVDTTAHEGLVLSLTHPEAQWSVRMGRHGQRGDWSVSPETSAMPKSWTFRGRSWFFLETR